MAQLNTCKGRGFALLLVYIYASIKNKGLMAEFAIMELFDHCLCCMHGVFKTAA